MGQFALVHLRAARALVLGVFKAQAMRHALSPHLQASAHPCSWAQVASAKHSANSELHLDSAHWQIEGQAVVLQSGKP